jgi:hypothetical protein
MKTNRILLGVAVLLFAMLGGGLTTASARCINCGHYRHGYGVRIVRPAPVYSYGYYPRVHRYYRPHPYVYGRVWGGPGYYHHGYRYYHHRGWR